MAKYLMFAPTHMARKIKLAILDLYEGQPNQGMRCLRDLIQHHAESHGLIIEWKEFEVRQELQVPDLSYDIYISSGGPGSPLDSENSEWEKKYFGWLSEVQDYNANMNHPKKKHVFFICHSFQLVCRQLKVAWVTKRKSTAFGVFPVHLENLGRAEPVFSGLQDPFYAVDSRDFQVIQPNLEKMETMGAQILAIEKERPHVPLERAVMAMRFDDYMIGTQFHPEADAQGMSMYLHREDKMKMVIKEHGQEKWQSMIEQLNDPDKILSTYGHVIPNFLDTAIGHLQAASA